MDRNMYRFGQALKEIRESFNYTQQEVTLLLGSNGDIPGLVLKHLEELKTAWLFLNLKL